MFIISSVFLISKVTAEKMAQSKEGRYKMEAGMPGFFLL
jgi:hypothetical protein